MADRVPASTASLRAANVLRWLIGIVIVLFSLRLDSGTAGYDIDPSWSAVMSWGWTHGMQWGRDLIFSYGPYAFLSPLFSYDPAMFPLARFGQLAYALLYALMTLVALRSVTTAILLGLLVSLVIFAAFWPGDAMWLLGFPMAMLALRESTALQQRWGVAAAVLVGVVVAVPLLVKFSNLPLWFAWMLACLLLPSLRQRAAIAIGASVVTVLALWWLAGQSLAGMGDYLATSLQIVAYYGRAMQIPPSQPATDVWVAIISATGMLVLLVTALRGNGSVRDRLIGFLLCALCLALAYRIAFVRADYTHRIVIFAVLAVIGWLAAAWSQRRDSWVAGAVMTLLSLCLLLRIPAADMRAGIPSAALQGRSAWRAAGHGVDVIFDGAGLRARMDQQRALVRSGLALPRLRERIGDEPVDIYPAAQGQLFANDLNYSPRPAFQSYVVYADAMADANQRHLASARAAPWALLLMHGIDERLPGGEDAQSLLYLLQHYRLVDAEQRFLLFQRVTDSKPSIDAWSASQPLRFGEWRALPATTEGGLVVAIETEADGMAALLGLIWREPRLFVDLKLADGNVRSLRLIPEVARRGVLLSPLLDDNHALATWLHGDPANSVVAIRLSGDPASPGAGFNVDVRLRWAALHALPQSLKQP